MDAIEVYDSKRSRQITWIIPLLIIAEILKDLLASKGITIRITIIADRCMKWMSCWSIPLIPVVKQNSPRNWGTYYFRKPFHRFYRLGEKSI